MPINLEVKGTVAKLLAQENLLVEHRQVQTAQFNVETRVLTLPIWDKATDTIFDLLVAHEVGHALYTPNEDWTEKCKAPKQFLNVVEDVRIEKLIKRRFPGLSKTFYKGYGELHEMDFFMLADEDISKMNLADRVNLHFKIGSFLGVKFTAKEQTVVDAISQCETFEDVIRASELLYKFCKEEEQQQSTDTPVEGQHQQSGQSGGQTQGSNDSDFEEEGETDDSSEKGNSSGGSTQGSEDLEVGAGDPIDDNISVNTMDRLEDKLQDLIDNYRKDFKYIECSDIPLDKVIVKNSEISERLESFWKNVYIEDSMKDYYLGGAKKEYRKYKNESQKEVNYLVKEFECKKSADSYARASVSRTGVLDCTKLHTYKYNEDLFKKVTTFADGKNHGLIFVLDWSGSMGSILGSTVKQMFNLIWFCRKVKIPFKVYGFTNAWYDTQEDEYQVRSLIKNPVKDTFWIDKNFRMLEFLDSNCNAQDFERQCLNFWSLVTGVSNDLPGHVDYPASFQLSGTPLNEALLTLHKIIPSFKAQHKLQKLHTIILTDGDAAPVAYASERYTYNGQKEINAYHIRWGDNFHIRDRKLRTTYKLGENHTIPILKNLSDNYPEVNFIGIRIATAGELGRFIRSYDNFDAIDVDKIQSQFKKEKSASVSIPSFSKFFVLSSNNLHEDSSFTVEEGAGKATIRAAFKKSLNKSKFNRKILSEFVTLVA